MKINPNGFREYDARWIFEKDIDIEGITNLGKGLGTQVIKHTKKDNPRIIVGQDYRSYSEKIKKGLIDGLIFFRISSKNPTTKTAARGNEKYKKLISKFSQYIVKIDETVIANPPILGVG